MFEFHECSLIWSIRSRKWTTMNSTQSRSLTHAHDNELYCHLSHIVSIFDLNNFRPKRPKRTVAKESQQCDVFVNGCVCVWAVSFVHSAHVLSHKTMCLWKRFDKNVRHFANMMSLYVILYVSSEWKIKQLQQDVGISLIVRIILYS